MSRDLLSGWGQPRLGLDHDPCWADYWQWKWERLPLSFPACTVDVQQHPLGRPDLSVTLQLDRDLPLICRIDDGNGRILAEIAPQPATSVEDPPVFARLEVAADDLPKVIGLGFEWVFFVPLRRYQPTKPLGIVQTPIHRLAGYQVDVSVQRTAS